jgi:hypothetical protein
MDDPNEEFVFYLEALQSKLEGGSNVVSKVLEAPEPVKNPVMNTQVEKVTTSNISSIIVNYLYEQARSKAGDTVLAGNILNLKDFDVYKKKDNEDFNLQFDKCMQLLEAEGLLIPTAQVDVYGYNRLLLEKLPNSLHERLRNEEEMEFNFQQIYSILNHIVSPRVQGMVSKEMAYRIVNELYKANLLYKTDKNAEKYGVS